MKRALTPMLLALLALPILADDTKKSETKAETTTPATTETAAAQPAPAAPAQEDSPLVQAAKRSNRLGKKPTNVITNETLKKSGEKAHVTTTVEQTPIRIAPPHKKPAPTPEMVHNKRVEEARKAAEEQAAAEKKKAAEREQRRAQAAEGMEEEYPEDVDPAQAEKAAQDANAPEPAADKKPPLE